MKIAVASSHAFGRGVVLGAMDAIESVGGSLHALIRPPLDVSLPLLSARHDSLEDLALNFRYQVQISDMTSLCDDEGVVAEADLVMVAGWRRLISASCLEHLRKADTTLIGYHPSPLPVGRGMSPISNTIRFGLTRSCVAAFELRETADSGEIIGQQWYDVRSNDHAAQVFGYALVAHRSLSARITEDFIQGRLKMTPQTGEVVLWQQTRQAERTLEPHLNSYEIADRIRAYSYPYDPCLISINDVVHDVVGCRVNGVVYGHISRNYNTIAYAARDTIVDLYVAARDESNNTENRGYVLSRQLESAIPSAPYDRKYAGVILALPDGRIVLQQRDNKAGIINPGGITLFGGVVEGAETFEEGAIREMGEELELEADALSLQPLGYTHKIEPDGSVTLCKMFLTTLNGIDKLVQHEGAGLYVATKSEIEMNPKVSEVCKTTVRSVT